MDINFKPEEEYGPFGDYDYDTIVIYMTWRIKEKKVIIKDSESKRFLEQNRCNKRKEKIFLGIFI